jgi:hypothetical protein
MCKRPNACAALQCREVLSLMTRGEVITELKPSKIKATKTADGKEQKADEKKPSGKEDGEEGKKKKREHAFSFDFSRVAGLKDVPATKPKAAPLTPSQIKKKKKLVRRM